MVAQVAQMQLDDCLVLSPSPFLGFLLPTSPGALDSGRTNRKGRWVLPWWAGPAITCAKDVMMPQSGHRVTRSLHRPQPVSMGHCP